MMFRFSTRAMTELNEFRFEKANGFGWGINLMASCCTRSAHSVSITVCATGYTTKLFTFKRKCVAMKKMWSK